MRKWLLFIVIAIISAFVLAACGDAKETTDDTEATDDGNDGDTYVVVATQILEHPSLDEAYKVLQDALEDTSLDIKYDYQNAHNDYNNFIIISDSLIPNYVDLFFANSTPCALCALNATDNNPILCTSVTDAVNAVSVPSMDDAWDII